MKWLSRRVARPGPYLTLCLSEAEYKKVLTHCGIKSHEEWMHVGADATTHHLYNSKSEGVSVVCLGDCSGREAVEIAGLLIHEAVHIWQWYVELIGEKHPGDEQEAYAIQCISLELLFEYARRTK